MLVLSRERTMKRSRFSEEQIVAVLQEWDAGAKIADLVRRHGVTEQTLYRWKKKYGGLQANEAKRLKALEEENRQLNPAQAPGRGSSAQSAGGEGPAGKKVVTPADRRTAVTHAM